MKIYLIRHGQTTGDLEDRYGGDYDDQLTEEGNRQAQELAEKLKDSQIELIFCSPRIRAKETAKYLEDSTKAQIQVVDDLRERNQYGVLTGITKSEAKVKYPHLVEPVKERLNTIEGAESYDSLKSRTISTFDQILTSEKQTIAIVTHGGVIRAIFREILGQGEINIGDCAYVEIVKDDENKLNVTNLVGVELQSD